MSRTGSDEAEHNAIRTEAALIAAAACTAPKARGVDAIRAPIVDGADLGNSCAGDRQMRR